MDKKNLMPQVAQPVNRISTGQLPESLAELSEEALQLHGNSAKDAAVVFASGTGLQLKAGYHYCSYDGDDAE